MLLISYNLQELHPKLHRHVKNRLQSLSNGKGIDFATAEVRSLLCLADVLDISFTGTRNWLADEGEHRRPYLGSRCWTRNL